MWPQYVHGRNWNMCSPPMVAFQLPWYPMCPLYYCHPLLRLSRGERIALAMSLPLMPRLTSPSRNFSINNWCSWVWGWLFEDLWESEVWKKCSWNTLVRGVRSQEMGQYPAKFHVQSCRQIWTQCQTHQGPVTVATRQPNPHTISHWLRATLRVSLYSHRAGLVMGSWCAGTPLRNPWG